MFFPATSIPMLLIKELQVVKKMERRVLLVCITVGFLGILATTLAFVAEAKRIKASQIQFTAPSVCKYPRSPALGLGLTASVALMIAKVIINVAAGCICCKRNSHPSNANWTLALFCIVFSWFAFVIAFLLLLTGAALNDQHGEESMYAGDYCYVVKPGLFALAALLSFASIALGVVYYLTVSSAKYSEQWGVAGHPNQGGIAMAQPQSAQRPIFVPEDFYNRQHP